MSDAMLFKVNRPCIHNSYKIGDSKGRNMATEKNNNALIFTLTKTLKKVSHN